MAMPSRHIRRKGGQWACVFVDLSFVGYLPEDRNLVRWIYTAITRATKRVYLFRISRRSRRLNSHSSLILNPKIELA